MSEVFPTLLYLAPIQGITDHIYRNCYCHYFTGIDAVFTPFIADVSTVKVNKNKLKDIKPVEAEGVRTVPQFLSNNPEEILLIANAFADSGFTEMNWNMGCPFSKVANKKRGCGILPYPEMVEKIMDMIMNKLPLALSVKTRLGRYNNSELISVLDILNRYPVSEIIIQARSGIQMYKGATQPDKFAEYRKLTNLPTVYNGDIFTVDDFFRLNQQFNDCKRWMIGRGVLQNPFLPADIKQKNEFPEPAKQLKLMQFHKALFEAYRQTGKEKNYAITKMKAIMFYMKNSFNPKPDIEKKLFKAKDDKDYWEAFDKMCHV